ncbi:MAG: class I SAM-dependent methyltransferase, partial [Clostridia bacterium]|nr:class I SAM-dependent methyltransferase [Clostridia bacterium]
HVDASKGMVQWAKENAVASAVADKNVRWLVDDCLKFVKREIRRGNTYDAIIMDPPSYGRGPGGEVWKLEQQLAELLSEAGKLLSKDAIFFFLNSYTGGLSPSILNYMVKRYVVPNRDGEIFTDEIGLYVTDKDISLPAGNTTIWKR